MGYGRSMKAPDRPRADELSALLLLSSDSASAQFLDAAELVIDLQRERARLTEENSDLRLRIHSEDDRCARA